MTSEMLAKSAWADHSSADPAAIRAEAERVQHEGERLRAIRVVAAAASNVDDARTLLDMLGADLDELRRAAGQRTVAA